LESTSKAAKNCSDCGLGEGEGAKFYACVDGLKGLPEAIESIFPKTTVQTCVVHLVRHSLNFVGHKERKAVASD
jgi:transposase-like protein